MRAVNRHAVHEHPDVMELKELYKKTKIDFSTTTFRIAGSLIAYGTHMRDAKAVLQVCSVLRSDECMLRFLTN